MYQADQRNSIVYALPSSLHLLWDALFLLTIITEILRVISRINETYKLLKTNFCTDISACCDHMYKVCQVPG